MYGFSSFYFYFFVLYLLYAILLAKMYKGKANRQPLIIGLFIPLFIVAGMRGETVGGDLVNYLPKFDDACRANKIEDLMSVSGHEPGYILLTKLISFISPTHRCFLLCTSFLTLLGPFYFFFKYSNKPVLSLLMFCFMGYYTNTYNNIRQSLAVSLFFFSIPYLLNKNLLKYFLLVALSSLFHYSAAAMLLLYPLIGKEHTIFRILMVLSVSTAVFVLMGSDLLISIVTYFLIKYDPESLLDNQGRGIMRLIMYIIILIMIVIIYFIKKKKIPDEEKLLFNLLLSSQVACVIFQMFASLFPSMTRLTIYTFIPIVVTIPRFYKLCRGQLLGYCIIFVMVGLCLFNFYDTYRYNPDIGGSIQDIIPYVFNDVKIL